MKLAEYKDVIQTTNHILHKTIGESPDKVFKALLDAFPGQVPLYNQFNAAYHPQITSQQLLRSLFPKVSSKNPQRRQPTNSNAKYSNRRNPLEVVRPSKKQKNWREDHHDPTIIFTNPESWRDMPLLNMMANEAKSYFEKNDNILFVLQAFYQRVDMFSGGLSEAKISDVKSRECDFEMHDGGGLYLLVTTEGLKQWHLEYKLRGETRDFYFADYPDNRLSRARCYLLAFKDLLKKDMDPSCIKFSAELQARRDCLYSEETDVPIPAWMAQALADGFKQYYSRRFLSRQNITLDSAFGIEGNIRRSEFDFFTIDTCKLLEKAREIQWYCNLSFATAANHALKFLQIEHDARGDNLEGEDLFTHTHASIKTLCEREARNDFGSYSAWCEDKGYSIYASKIIKESFMELIEELAPELRESIETDMKDNHKKLIS